MKHPIEVSWNLGQFSVSLACTIGEEIVGEVLKAGVLQSAQRASGIDEAMGGYTSVAGKKVRLKDFRRADVPYSKELAEKLAELFKTLKFGDGQSKVELPATVSVYEKPESGAEVKYAREKKVLAARLMKGGTLESLAEKLGFAGDCWTGEGEDREPSEGLLAAVRVALVAEAKRQEEAMASI